MNIQEHWANDGVRVVAVVCRTMTKNWWFFSDSKNVLKFGTLMLFAMQQTAEFENPLSV